jgi:ABC-type phosphate/phosphonate transport system permease subunit
MAAIGTTAATLLAIPMAMVASRNITQDFPMERLALHICLSNWTADEGAALAGDYVPLVRASD